MGVDLVLTAPKPISESEQRMDLIKMAMQAEGTPQERAALVKELVELHQSMTRFDWEGQERQAKIDFDDALNDCQKQIGRIAPNQKRESGIMWADYAQLDRTLRNVYTAAGFSIAFSEDQSTPGRLRMKACLSRSGVSKEYFAEIAMMTGNPKMSQMDVEASAASRVKRYLLLDIFNVAIGIDTAEKHIYEQAECMNDGEVQSYIDALNKAPSYEALKSVFSDCYSKAKGLKDEAAKKRFTAVYEPIKREFQGGAR